MAVYEFRFGAIQNVCHSARSEKGGKNRDKKWHGGGGEGGEGVQPIVFTPLNSSVSIFSAGKFLLLYISWDHDSVTVSNNKQVQVVIFLSEIGLLLDP